ncbi:hypothetical protein VN97_g8002 [Penicillium thymicola]|uniref:Uncharacterized protein n=1 Tax=Penicillium thymicola TaxID=293382 RepID=A0AAI9TDJ1_PENTH|nr:hypothetical protein VN97_g8002 [Penicillium thymicola]
MNMSQEPAPGLVLLTELATIIRAIAANLRENRLDRKSFQGLLYEYASRAGSDGQLIYASRQNPRSVNAGLFLAYTHVELVSWLVKNNYTMNSTSVKWFSWKKIFSKYRLPLFSISSQTAELHENLRNIEKKAGMLYAVLQANDVRPHSPFYSTGHKLTSQRFRFHRQPLHIGKSHWICRTTLSQKHSKTSSAGAPIFNTN